MCRDDDCRAAMYNHTQDRYMANYNHTLLDIALAWTGKPREPARASIACEAAGDTVLYSLLVIWRVSRRVA